MVVHKAIRGLLLPEVFSGIRPKYITHEARCWWLPESVNLQCGVRCTGLRTAVDAYVLATHPTQVVQGIEFRRKASVYAEELLVHDGRQR